MKKIYTTTAVAAVLATCLLSSCGSDENGNMQLNKDSGYEYFSKMCTDASTILSKENDDVNKLDLKVTEVHTNDDSIDVYLSEKHYDPTYGYFEFTKLYSYAPDATATEIKEAEKQATLVSGTIYSIYTQYSTGDGNNYYGRYDFDGIDAESSTPIFTVTLYNKLSDTELQKELDECMLKASSLYEPVTSMLNDSKFTKANITSYIAKGTKVQLLYSYKNTTQVLTATRFDPSNWAAGITKQYYLSSLVVDDSANNIRTTYEWSGGKWDITGVILNPFASYIKNAMINTLTPNVSTEPDTDSDSSTNITTE